MHPSGVERGAAWGRGCDRREVPGLSLFWSLFAADLLLGPAPRVSTPSQAANGATQAVLTQKPQTMTIFSVKLAMKLHAMLCTRQDTLVQP